jgi:beta-galactosidase
MISRIYSIGMSFNSIFYTLTFKYTCGDFTDEMAAMINEKHPIFEEFPTEKYPDYQWIRLLEYSYSMDISDIRNELDPILENVPNYYDNTPSSALF